MAEDIRLATAKELSEVKTELEKKANVSDIESKGYLKRQIVGTLPSVPVIYDFEDGQARFTVPKIDAAENGTSEIIEDETGNKYQSICSTGAEGASVTIGSNSIVYSELDLSSILNNANNILLEFDFKMNLNGRIRVSIGNLDIIRKISGSTKYEMNGIAADLFSNTGKVFEICGSGSVHDSFFGQWIHCKFEFDVRSKTVKYTVTNKSISSDTQSGTATFRGVCDNITGIALYTWLADDTACFDNISIIVRDGADEIDDRTIYIIKEDEKYKEYIYINGNPVLLGSSDMLNLIKDLTNRIEALEHR